MQLNSTQFTPSAQLNSLTDARRGYDVAWRQMAFQFSTPVEAILAELHPNTPAPAESPNTEPETCPNAPDTPITLADNRPVVSICPECGSLDVNGYKSQRICTRCLHEWVIS